MSLLSLVAASRMTVALLAVASLLLLLLQPMVSNFRALMRQGLLPLSVVIMTGNEKDGDNVDVVGGHEQELRS